MDFIMKQARFRGVGRRLEWAGVGITFVLLSIRVNEAQNAEKSTIQFPQRASRGTAMTWTSSNEVSTVGGISIPRGSGGGRRRAASEGMAATTPNVA